MVVLEAVCDKMFNLPFAQVLVLTSAVRNGLLLVSQLSRV